ncbi:MAG TPA: chromosomal replication initiator protein DnaA [Actinomycetota bacterium]|nr:chromosomal replication initiator protein DnaA [Actinomycetota bacterium]
MTSPLVERPVHAPVEPSRATWAAIMDRARRDLPEAAFNLWFADLRPGDLRGDVLELIVPSAYVKNWLAAHHMDLITGSAREILGPAAKVRLKLERPKRAQQDPPADPTDRGASDDGRGPASSRRRARASASDQDQPTLDEALGRHLPFPDRYTFDTFVPGPSNKFAHAAALAVAEAPPSKAYNPVFVYGGVGLGKTHLLFAIANHMWALSPRTRVRYVTSETFMTEFIKAVRERRGYLFQRQYRDVDVLLLDDVQFLARAEETQTEFFHTFNHLHQHERQIVIASDRPPQELGGIEERLRSRFRSGLVVDVQPPDLETRIAIVQIKAQRDHLDVPDDVLHFIASKFESNIRELEGALLRVAAFASLSRQYADLALAERALEDLIPESGQEIRPDMILEETATYFGLGPGDLVSKSRSRPLTTARHVAMYLLRELTGLSLIKIGEHFERDHTTVLHGIKKIEGLMPARGSTYKQVQELTKKIRARTRGV